MVNTGDDWHRALSKRVGEAVANRRKQLGMTAQQLATRCGELGVPIHRTTITKIENGRPRFDLGELVALAMALDTSPVSLVYPGPHQSMVDVVPKVEVTEYHAAEWFSGSLPIWTAEDEKEARAMTSRWVSANDSLRLWRNAAEIERSRQRIVKRGDVAEDLEIVALIDKQVDRIIHMLGITHEDMRTAGVLRRDQEV